jgi:hypothetical protein
MRSEGPLFSLDTTVMSILHVGGTWSKSAMLSCSLTASLTARNCNTSARPGSALVLSLTTLTTVCPACPCFDGRGGTGGASGRDGSARSPRAHCHLRRLRTSRSATEAPPDAAHDVVWCSMCQHAPTNKGAAMSIKTRLKQTTYTSVRQLVFRVVRGFGRLGGKPQRALWCFAVTWSREEGKKRVRAVITHGET